MLVHVLPDDGSVDAGGVSLVTDGLLVLELSLGTVAGGVVLVDVLLDVARDLGCDVLVVGVHLLLVTVGDDVSVVCWPVSFSNPSRSWNKQQETYTMG